MRVVRLDPLTDPRWAAFIADADGAGVFHHPAWLGLVARRYRYPMSAVCLLGADGGIEAGLPLALVASRLTGRRLVAVPFSDSCAPAYAPRAGEEAAEQLGHALAAEQVRTGLGIEVRWRLDAGPGAQVAGGFLAHRLALEPDADAVLARASRSQVRRGIAKAEREGVRTTGATDRAALRDFYALHLQTRRRQAVPTQPKGFILGFEALFAAGLGSVMTARHDGLPIAAAVFLRHGRTLTYKYGASDGRFLHLRPNHALFAAAIREACAAGLTELDFGRTDPDNEGLARFKRSWGAREEPLQYTFLGGRAPDPGNGLGGRLVASAIRRGPPATGRVIGTALYRHVG